MIIMIIMIMILPNGVRTNGVSIEVPSIVICLQ